MLPAASGNTCVRTGRWSPGRGEDEVDSHRLTIQRRAMRPEPRRRSLLRRREPAVFSGSGGCGVWWRRSGSHGGECRRRAELKLTRPGNGRGRKEMARPLESEEQANSGSALDASWAEARSVETRSGHSLQTKIPVPFFRFLKTSVFRNHRSIDVCR